MLHRPRHTTSQGRECVCQCSTLIADVARQCFHMVQKTHNVLLGAASVFSYVLQLWPMLQGDGRIIASFAGAVTTIPKLHRSQWCNRVFSRGVFYPTNSATCDGPCVNG